MKCKPSCYALSDINGAKYMINYMRYGEVLKNYSLNLINTEF